MNEDIQTPDPIIAKQVRGLARLIQKAIPKGVKFAICFWAQSDPEEMIGHISNDERSANIIAMQRAIDRLEGENPRKHFSA